MPKRLIEDILPLGELNQYAQKGGGIGSLNAMHPYFARRPLTASRAMTLAALVDAPHEACQLGRPTGRKSYRRLSRRAVARCGRWRRPLSSCYPRTTPSARR